MSSSSISAAPDTGGSFWHDQKIRGILAQAFVMALVAGGFFFIVTNTIENLDKRNIATGFGFLDQPAGFDIPGSLIEYGPTNTHGRVYLVGLLNTIQFSIIGCILATVLGFILGVIRLSNNWLLSKIVYWFVEFTRNVPVLLWIIFWWTIFLKLPVLRDSISILDTFHINNRGFYFPDLIMEDGSLYVIVSIFVAFVAIWFLRRWAKARQEATGEPFPTLLAGLGILIGLPAIVYFICGQPMTWDYAVLGRFNLKGGASLSPEFMGVLVGLVLYTAAFVSEIVRAGILSVHRGQKEAAAALGLRPNFVMRFIIIPQALRVIVPPLTSQYLNLTKNSSLGFAVGFSEIFAVFGGISLNQTGQAIECMAITMVTYLSISLGYAAYMNWYNKRIRLVER